MGFFVSFLCLDMKVQLLIMILTLLCIELTNQKKYLVEMEDAEGTSYGEKKHSGDSGDYTQTPCPAYDTGKKDSYGIKYASGLSTNNKNRNINIYFNNKLPTWKNIKSWEECGRTCQGITPCQAWTWIKNGSGIDRTNDCFLMV